MNEFDQTLNIEKKYVAIAQEVAQKLEQLKQVQTLLVIGSVAAGNPDEFSDIDLMALYNQEPSNEDIAKAMGMQRVQKFWRGENQFHVHFSPDHIHGSILFVPYEDMRLQVLKYPNLSTEEYAQIFSYVAQAQVLFDKPQVFRFWQKTAQVVPQKLRETIVGDRMAWLHYLLHERNLEIEAKRGDWLLISHQLNEAVEWIVGIVYALNNEVYVNLKRSSLRLNQMMKKPDRILERLQSITVCQHTSSDLDAKIAELTSLQHDLEPLILEQMTIELPK